MDFKVLSYIVSKRCDSVYKLETVYSCSLRRLDCCNHAGWWTKLRLGWGSLRSQVKAKHKDEK